MNNKSSQIRFLNNNPKKRNKNFPCPVIGCGKVYNQQKTLTQHLHKGSINDRSHDQARIDDMPRYLSQKNDYKPIECPEANCEHRSVSYIGLAMHY